MNFAAIELPEGWEARPFNDSFNGKPKGRDIPQLAASEIQEMGRLPVIGQGSGFIEGYSNSPEHEFPEDLLPVILFGPHTRCVKEVKQPFISGPNVRYIWPVADLDFDFAAFALRAVDVPSRGYNDHFSLLKEYSLPVPPRVEQQRIAQVLSTVQQAIEQQERLIRTTIELKQALMQKFFTEGPRGEPQKETEIGLVPESWEVVAVGSICRSIVPGRNKPKVFDGDIPWLTTPDIKDLDVVTTKVEGRRVSLEQIRASGGRLIPAQSVIMTCVGEFGISVVTEIECVINQQLHAFVCSDKINPIFLCNQLRFRKPFMQSIAHITTIPYLNKSKCESVPIALPPRAEQDEIANAFVRLDEKRDQHQKRLALHEDLFRTLLHELMTGKVRVGEMTTSAEKIMK